MTSRHSVALELLVVEAHLHPDPKTVETLLSYIQQAFEIGYVQGELEGLGRGREIANEVLGPRAEAEQPDRIVWPISPLAGD